MEKYYLMSIDDGGISAITILKIYYEDNKLLIKKLELFIKYINKIDRSELIQTINDIS
jgi:hypothetical protein